ncbi:uncharacterized protein K444DRAFT_606604 [Hyaloscypha bicolor E]|uniref:Fungal N-terminal domain-containing protein n=1 Tax=Hyaloscypha bicolor E TaxID=1095630 RepID=A0A2J6TXG1_9HELO|nr:uncharacterized protein K444DRAFT_606604 [Hyaloscypha bicolor E]PMD67703.1 hypothetical protein K444DRAFT_606604 [Hyaloscypha bicolor E]
MDPLSIAVSAAGLLSLLLQVSQSLITYYESWESQDVEIANTLQHLNNLRDTASVLSHAIPKISHHQIFGVDNFQRSLSRLEEGQKKLAQTLIKCRSQEPPKSLKDRLQQNKKKLIYPFKRATIQGLNQTISELKDDLSLASEAMQLNILSNQLETSKEVKRIAISIESVATQSQSTVEALKANTSNNEAAISLANHKLQSIHEISSNTCDSVLKLDAKVDTISSSAEQVSGVAGLDTKLNQICDQLSEIQRHMQEGENLKPSISSAEQVQIELIRKPSLLSWVCNTNTELNAKLSEAEATIPGGPSNSATRALSHPCSCYRRSYLQARATQWGPLHIFRHTQTAEAHDKHCPYYVRSSKKSSFGARITVLNWFLAKAIEISFNHSEGAGGSSMSPTLTLRSLVRNDSPAFTLLNRNEVRKYWANKNYLRQSLEQILKLFQEGEASPYDVDKKGRNLLHHVHFALSDHLHHRHKFDEFRKVHWLPDPDEMYKTSRWIELTVGLFDAHVPAYEPDCHYATLWDDLALGSGDRPFSQASLLVMAQLASRGADAVKLINNGFEDEVACVNSCHFVRQVPEVYEESFGIGPLSSAIRRRNEDDVLRILSKFPNSLMSEKTIWDQNPLHLAFDWPRGLRILLNHGGSQLIKQPERQGHTPLAYSFHSTDLEAPHILLSTSLENKDDILQFAISWFRETDRWGRPSYAREIGEPVLSLVVSIMARHREILYHETTISLSSDIHAAPHLDTDENLDVKFVGACRATDSEGIKLRAPMRAQREYPWEFVYHQRDLTMIAADKLWEAGFVDIDVENEAGFTPIELHCSEGDCHNFFVVLWLLGKGVSMRESQSPPTHGRGLATPLPCYIWYFLSEFSDYHRAQTRPLFYEVSKAYPSLYSLELYDDCCCPCTSSGCNLVVFFLKGSRSYEDAEEVLSFMDDRRDQFVGSLAYSILRLATFEALGLTHTCCKPVCKGGKLERFAPRFEESEEHELHYEERHGIEQLKLLVDEFMAHYLATDGLIAHFLRGYWKIRMLEYISSGKLENEEDTIQGMINVGVVPISNTGNPCSERLERKRKYAIEHCGWDILCGSCREESYEIYSRVGRSISQETETQGSEIDSDDEGG